MSRVPQSSASELSFLPSAHSPHPQLSAEGVRKSTPSPAVLLSLPLAKWTHLSEALPPQNILIPSFAIYPLIKTYPLPPDRGAFTRQETAALLDLMDSSLLRQLLSPHLKLLGRGGVLGAFTATRLGLRRVTRYPLTAVAASLSTGHPSRLPPRWGQHTHTHAAPRAASPGRPRAGTVPKIQAPVRDPLATARRPRRPRPRAHPQSGAGHQRQSGSEAR